MRTDRNGLVIQCKLCMPVMWNLQMLVLIINRYVCREKVKYNSSSKQTCMLRVHVCVIYVGITVCLGALANSSRHMCMKLFHHSIIQLFTEHDLLYQIIFYRISSLIE